MAGIAVNGLDGRLVKVMAWYDKYDNEWWLTCQMTREAVALLGLPTPDLRRAGP